MVQIVPILSVSQIVYIPLRRGITVYIALLAGQYIYRPRGKYIIYCPASRAIYNILPWDVDSGSLRRWNIYYIYQVFSGNIQLYGPSTSDFSSSAFGLGRKNPRFRGHIVVYCPQKPNIYITYIFLFGPHIIKSGPQGPHRRQLGPYPH